MTSPKPITLTQVDEQDYAGPDPQHFAVIGEMPGGGGGGGAVDSVNGKAGVVVLTAADVDAKPADYEPDLSGLVEDGDPRLSDARTPLAHTHAIADVTGLSGALGEKADLDDIPATPADIGAAPASHTHSIAQVTSLQGALDGKATSAQGALADTAVQPDDPRLPIVMTQAQYDGITPVAGQVYIIQG